VPQATAEPPPTVVEIGRQSSGSPAKIDRSMAQTAQAASPSISSRVTFRVTLAVIGLYIVVAVALLPIASDAGPFMPGFNAFFAGGSFVAEIATAFLLLVLLHQTPRLSVLLLANAYLYSALMALAYVLSYPGAIARDRPLIGGMQTVSWVFNGWISGFALLAFAAVVVELRGSPSFDRARARRLAYGASAIVAAITVVLIAVFVTHSDRLPQLVTGNS
jgi:two-component system sensor histidine kinase/response regulator